MIARILAALSGLLPAGLVGLLWATAPADLPWAGIKGIPPAAVSLAVLFILAALGSAAFLGRRAPALVLSLLHAAAALATAGYWISVFVEEEFRMKDLGPMVTAVCFGVVIACLVFARADWIVWRKAT